MITDIFNVLQLQKQPHHQHNHWVQEVQQQCAVCQLTRLYHPFPVIHYVVQVTSIYYSLN